jgi:hypothetical protein
MIITYFRSSSYNTWDFCEHKYYLDYCLGYHSPANKKAQKGCIVHKALELLAQVKLAIQNNTGGFSDQELQCDWLVDHVRPEQPEEAIDTAYKYYVGKGEYAYSNSDFDDCRKWMYDALNWKDGMFSPLKLNILSPEQYFDFEIKEPWAKYSYSLQDGRKLEGYLALKGTVDLVVSRTDNVIEVIDWKTGRKYDWSKEKDKRYNDLYYDSQLRIYHYAISKLYPQAKEIFFTIFYIQDGGPHSICFERNHLKETEAMLQQRFHEIANTTQPKLIYPNWKCTKLCWFGRNGFNGPTTDFSKTICQEVAGELLQLGIDKVTANRAKHSNFNSYGSGGGKTHDGT